MSDPNLKIRVTADLAGINAALAQLQSGLAGVGAAGAAVGKQISQGLSQAERAAQAEASAIGQLITSLQRQAEAYGLTGVKLLELNKQRDLARVKTEAERKAVSAAYDTMITKAKAAEAAQVKAAKASTASLGSIKNAVVGLATSFVALQAIRITIGFGDKFAQLNGVLKLATHSTEEFSKAQAGVLKIANDTRAPVKETADTYAALERTTRAVGLSQDELLRALTTVNKAIGLTPVSAQAAQSALVQFGQALGGNFQAGAQELNSILEQTPGLAITIAKGLGVETSALKKMGEEGKLSTELVVRGLLRVSNSVDEQFKNVPKTISGVLQTIQNDLLFAIGSAGMQPLVDALEQFRKIITDPAVVAGLVVLAKGVVTFTSALVKATAATVDFVKNAGEGLAAMIHGINPDDVERLGDVVTNLQRKIADFEGRGDDIIGFNQKQITKLRAELALAVVAYDAAKKSAQGFAAETAKSDAAAADAAKAAQKKAEEDFLAAQKKAGAKAATKASLEQNSALLADSTDRALRELDRLYAEGKVKLLDYFNQKRALQIEAINAAIELAKFESQNGDKPEERSKSLTKIALLERQRNDVVKQSAQDRLDAQKQLARDLQDIEDQIATGSGDKLAERVREITRNREALLKKFSNDPDAAVLINKLFDVDLARARSEAISTEADRLIKNLQDKENSVSNQIAAGVISQATGEQQLRKARQETIDQLIVQRDALQEVYNTAPTQEALDAITEFNRQIGEIGVRNATGLQQAIMDLRTSLAAMQEQFAGDAISSLTDGFTKLFESLADGSQSAGDALREFVRGFAQAMLQIAARAIATYIVLSLLDAIYPGLGRATIATMGGASGGTPQAGGGGIRTAHTGGIISQFGGTRRHGVSPAVFAGAPRFHAGGVAGLAPGEVPAILQTGEEVLARNDPRNAMNGGGQQQGGGVRVLNIFDQNFVADNLNSAAGEKVFMNFIGKNPGRVKAALGM